MGVRVTGLNSGMDTDSIVEALVSAQRTKVDNLKKKQTKLSWTQDAWKSLNTKIYSFYSKTLNNAWLSTTFNLKKNVVSDTSIATVSGGSVNGTQSLEVNKLAQNAYLTGGKMTRADGAALTDATKVSELTGYAGGSSTITINGKDIKLTDDMTLSSLTTKIKSAGVNVSLDANNGRMFVSAKKDGEAGNFTISGDTTALAALGLETIDSTTASHDATTSTGASFIRGQDAEIKLNGAIFTSDTNNFSVNGMSITALKETNGTSVSVSTNTDVDAIYDKVKDFFKEYNELIKEMEKLYNADSAKGYEPLTDDEKEALSDDEVEKWETKIKDALLRKDTTLSDVTTTLKTAMMQSVTIGGKDYNLSSFGINTLGYFEASDNEKGVYHIDGDKDDESTSGETDKLKAAIASDSDTFISFFNKLAKSVYDDLGKKMKSIKNVRSAYTVYNDKEMQRQYDDYSDQISTWEDKLKDLEDKYYKQFSAMETALAKINSQSSSLAGLLGTGTSA